MDEQKAFEIIWAPWRMAYISGQALPSAKEQSAQNRLQEVLKTLTVLPGGQSDCFLCQAAADSQNDDLRYILGRTPHTITLLNRYPYNNGHLLVAPKRHLAQLNLLSSEEWQEISSELTYWTDLIREKMNADGFNVGLNLGQVAGAGLPGHLHWHIVPRWNGDTNFMTTIASTKAIPQSLEALWGLLQRKS